MNLQGISKDGGSRRVMAKPAKRTGRPSSFTHATADKICDLIEEGEALNDICKRSGMPTRTTVKRWLRASTEFRAQYMRAREEAAFGFDDKIVAAVKAVNSENAHAVRVQVEAYKWLAGKRKPKVYGDRLQVDHKAVPPADIDLSALSPEAMAELRRVSERQIAERDRQTIEHDPTDVTGEEGDDA